MVGSLLLLYEKILTSPHLDKPHHHTPSYTDVRLRDGISYDGTRRSDLESCSTSSAFAENFSGFSDSACLCTREGLSVCPIGRIGRGRNKRWIKPKHLED